MVAINKWTDNCVKCGADAYFDSKPITAICDCCAEETDRQVKDQESRMRYVLNDEGWNVEVMRPHDVPEYAHVTVFKQKPIDTFYTVMWKWTDPETGKTQAMRSSSIDMDALGLTGYTDRILQSASVPEPLILSKPKFDYVR
jgi:hypothetical protein